MSLTNRRPTWRLEAAVYVLIAALLALLLIDRLQRYAELAETAAVQATVVNLQTALQVRFMLDARDGGPAAVAARWHDGNPVALAGAPPPNYLGERFGVDLRDVPGGSWVFDREHGQLLYVPRMARLLSLPGLSAPVPALRFALRIEGPPHGPAWLVRLKPVYRIRRARTDMDVN